MEVTVLGASAACPYAGGACSGYLIQTESDALLLDCGPGVVSNLRKHVRLHDLSGVLITHPHADHVLDLIPLRYGLRYSPNRNPTFRPSLYLPPGGIDKLRKVVLSLDGSEAFFDDTFLVYEYDPDKELVLGELTIHFAKVEHYVTTYAVKVTASDKVMVYSADTGPCDALIPFARDADLLICEATLQYRDESSGEEWGHLTAREAGEIAHQARVKRLVLTHLWEEHDREHLLEEARASYGGPIECAAEHKVYRV